MFTYEGPQSAIRTVKLGRLPVELPDVAVRQVILDKRDASDDSLRSAMARSAPPSGDRCLLCRLAFGAVYDDPGLGEQRITRNRRNRFYCNICDMFIRACPGQALLELPVLVVDVKNSQEIRKNPDVGLANYPKFLSAFHRRVSAIIQKHLGFVLNTVGDSVIGVWPSGFVPEEQRNLYGWDPENPARISAISAIQAAEELAASSPDEFDGMQLPYKGGLDSTEMVIFSVRSTSPVSELEFTDLDRSETGMPLIDDAGNLLLGEAGVPGEGSESEPQTGPAATDIAGLAVEVASELANKPDDQAGTFYITKRVADIANENGSSFSYAEMDGIDTRVRTVTR